MDTERLFSVDDWDPLAEVPMMHLSYLMHTLLPMRLIEWAAVKRHYDGTITGIKDSLTTDLNCIVTGSMAEGYGIPILARKTNPPSLQILSDVDVLLVNNHLPISTRALPEPNNTEFKAYLEYDNLHPGYTRVCIPHINKDDETFIFHEETGKYYLSSTNYVSKMFSTHSMWDLEETSEVKIQGPAITLEDRAMLTADNIDKPNAGISEDFVSALPCFPWPEVANAWKTRVEQSQWIHTSLVEEIVAAGCHVVGIPSKNSLKPELEWRLSFSASEGKLSREAVTDHQRQCYIYLKILRYQVWKSKSVLSSYVFKSVFLHCCEKLPVNYWMDYPGNCVLYMLDVILECLMKKHVPTYFLPENNLVDHLNEEEMSVAISAVEKLRLDPITPILDFMDGGIFQCHCMQVSFRQMVKPLLEDIAFYKEHRNNETSLWLGLYQTSYNICLEILKEQTEDQEAVLFRHQEAIRYMIDFHTVWLRQTQLCGSNMQFLNTVGLTIKNLKLAMRFLEAVVSLDAEYPELRSVNRGNLACMYHSIAYTHSDGSELRNAYLIKAGDMFKQVYEEHKCSQIDYVTYLVKLRKYEDAKRILDVIIGDINEHINTQIVYDAKEMDTLDDPLRQHVELHGRISGDAVSFAFFYTVKCLYTLEPGVQQGLSADTILEKFENYCEEKKNEHAYTLLGYAKQIAGTV